MPSDSLPRRVARLACGLVVVLLAGCAQLHLGAPVATIDNLQRARAIGIAPVAVGEFVLDPARPSAMDAGIDVRSNTVSSPYEGSFARYLKETLTVELAAAGLIDPASAVVIRGWLTDSRLSAGIPQGSGAVAARFLVARAGVLLYDRELAATATWESPFIGAVAIPTAINEYGALYRQLVGQLLGDPDFKAALALPRRP